MGLSSIHPSIHVPSICANFHINDLISFHLHASSTPTSPLFTIKSSSQNSTTLSRSRTALRLESSLLTSNMHAFDLTLGHKNYPFPLFSSHHITSHLGGELLVEISRSMTQPWRFWRISSLLEWSFTTIFITSS